MDGLNAMTASDGVRALFHVTTMAAAQAIMEYGLVPHTGPRSKKRGDHGVFLFASRVAAEDAVMNWLGDEFDEDEPLALLRVSLPDRTTIRREAFELVCETCIPPVCIEFEGII